MVRRRKRGEEGTLMIIRELLRPECLSRWALRRRRSRTVCNLKVTGVFIADPKTSF